MHPIPFELRRAFEVRGDAQQVLRGSQLPDGRGFLRQRETREQDDGRLALGTFST